MAADARIPVERIDGLLAKNLVAARCALGWTQDALSAASGISRATIAQLETGYSDPRLSTVEALARAFGLTVALLLFGTSELRSVAGLSRDGQAAKSLVSSTFLRRLEFQLQSNALKDTARVAELIRDEIAAQDSLHPTAVLLSSMFGAMRPDPGLALGAALGSVLADNGANASPS